jgi:hypothetical protein
MAQKTLLGDFSWLSFFSSDGYRLTAVLVIAIMFVLISCTKPISRAWSEDRADARSHERRKLALLMKLENERQKRRDGRLDLND